jgi:NAD(P)H dehydrogenase (quinone)
MARILVLYYSEQGHTEQMAMAVAHGARGVTGAEVTIKRIPPIPGKPEHVKPGSTAAQIAIATPDELKDYDGIIFGTPTRFGNMCAEMRYFLDQTSGLWASGGLVGRVASVFVSTSSQHGGHETTITSFHTTLLHHGMIIIGIPYTELGLMNMAEISGGSPYGAGTISASDDQRQPSDNEFDLAEAQGKRVATLAVRLYN